MTACATTASSVVVCPPVTDYSQEQRLRLADEVEAAPADAFWPEAMIDYAALRSRLRAACSPAD